MLNHLPVAAQRPKLTIAIVPGIVTLLLVATAFMSILNLRNSRRLVEHTHSVHNASSHLLTRMVDAETGVRAFSMSGNEAFLDPYVGAEADVLTDLQTLGRLTIDNPVQQRRLPELARLANTRFSAFRDGIERRRREGDAFAPIPAKMVDSKRVMDSLRTVVAMIDRDERSLLAQRDAQDRWNLEVAAFVIGVGGAIAVLIAFLANGTLARNLVRLGQANADLYVQAQRLEEQATELETQATELEATAVELETSNADLEEQATELHEQRDFAQMARAEAEQANAAKSRFLSVMSHELRTPLNAIVGYVDIMDAGVHGPVSDDQREDIRRIKRAVGQLTSVINDILNFAKLEAGEVRFDIGPVEMREALANASALMEPQAAAKKVQFHYHACQPGVVALADRERVQQVVLNLLSNAVKYTNPRGSVELACDMDDTYVHIRVTDTGRGIAPRDVQRIFDPFVQLLGAPHAPSEGVGLGLAISRDLARGMGGDITVTSVLGQGSTFEVLLPAAISVEHQLDRRAHDGDWSHSTTRA